MKHEEGEEMGCTQCMTVRKSRRYTLDRAWTVLVTDLIRDTLTSQTPRRNAIVPEMDVFTKLTTLKYLATGKCNYAAVMIWVCHNLL